MNIYGEYLQLARLALSGRTEDVLALLRRSARRSKNERPEFRSNLNEILQNFQSNQPLRRSSKTEFSNGGTQTSKILRQDTVASSIDPIWPDSLVETLQNIVTEQNKTEELIRAGIKPTRSILFVGPPGVGKTLAAKWLSKQLDRELLVLDLAQLMSSRLGKTGNNLATALADGANSYSVLLLDEFDSIAKRRDDQSDVGELKRLLNVLLQSIDRLPNDSLMVAATNHPELLDRAVWRRFDTYIEFPIPKLEDLQRYVLDRALSTGFNVKNELTYLPALALHGQSFAELDNFLNKCFRSSIIKSTSINSVIASESAKLLDNKSASDRITAAVSLVAAGFSQRTAANWLGVSRDSIRKRMTKT